MPTKQTQTNSPATQPATKKKYTPPQMTRHGSLVSRTQTVSST